MKYRSVSVVLSALLLAGCAGLMMDVKEADKKAEDVVIPPGGEVAIAEPDVSAIDDPEDAKRVKAAVTKWMKYSLKENKVKVSESASSKISITITNYESGCGFCRGFFPVFGLGDSAVDGNVTLEVDGRRRRLVVQKTGQATGMSQMGDQTETNIEYFSTVVSDRFTEHKSD